ncbi:MAG: putative lipid II flippase FtsW [Firmicutes bacterium]|nr:putative lipid II flippase FtsW [Bacillota bacterium]
MIKFDEPSRQERVKKEKRVREKKARVVNYEKIITTVSRFRPRYMNLPILVCVLGLSTFGVAMVYSASHYNATIYFNNPYYFFTSQLIGLVLGIVGLSLTYHLDYKIYRRFALPILIGAVVLLLLVFIPGLGIERLGARRWIGVGGFSMQPSEIAKFAFIIFAASVASGKFSKKTDTEINIEETPKMQLNLKQLSLILLAGGGMCGLILLQPNLSIVMTLGATMFACLFLFGAKSKHLGMLMIPVLVAVPIMLIAEPYRISRLVAFVDPWETPRAEGFQLIQSLFALGNGGLFGVGFGNSTQKYMFLPFSESDFIFSIIGEEFGLIGTLIYLFVLGFLITKIFAVAMKTKDTFGKFVCFGIGIVIFIQSALNIAVVTGSIPPTGLPLPFISFGGTSLAVFMSAVGIVLNIDKQNKRIDISP